MKAFTVTVPAPLADAEASVRAALAEQGFGVLTEIDVRATFAKKLDREFRPYVILGACNPHLAWRALGAEPGIGLLLPCNVVVTREDDAAVVSIADPRALAEAIRAPGMSLIAEEARERLVRALAAS